MDAELRAWLAAQGHSTAYGARPLQRLFTKTVRFLPAGRDCSSLSVCGGPWQQSGDGTAQVMNAVSSALLSDTGHAWSEGDCLVVRRAPSDSDSADSGQAIAGAGWQAGSVQAGIVVELLRAPAEGKSRGGAR